MRQTDFVMDFASKDETDVYFYLVDKGFDQDVAKILEGRLLEFHHARHV